jgi:deoxyribodipyrimidine photo-lyase
MSPAAQRMGPIIVWIRRELRLSDHLALWSAAKDSSAVVPLFIIDDAFRSAAPARQIVIRAGLEDLRSSLRTVGGDLIVRDGEPEHVLHALLRETGAAGVYATKRYHPEERSLDRRIQSSVEAGGKIWKEFKDQVLFEEREILTKSQASPFTVFTAYKNAWRNRQEEIAPPLPPPRSLRTPPIDAGALPEAPPASVPGYPSRPPAGGEREGRAALRAFLKSAVATYHTDRDVPGMAGTSRLSHHLATGSLGIRTVYHALKERAASERGLARLGTDTFLNELVWREFYYQILANYPHAASGSFKRAFDRLEWSDNRAHLEAWQSGATGYPIVDAAMRQLNAEGWMHNRCRMITANFLAKDLHISWQSGEAYFMRRLADGDVALNNGGWQWSAGTGNDAQPWFRIFNPVLQSKKFDPAGIYLRRYIPELARVPDAYLHEPWRMPVSVQNLAGCRIGRDYPSPVVDHGTERARALVLYGRIASQQKEHAS